MLRFISKLFRKGGSPNHLGRWQVVTNVKDGDRARREALTRAAMANMDSCGDNLCGDPIYFKKLVREDSKFQEVKHN